MSLYRKIIPSLVVLFTALAILPSCEKEEDHTMRETVVKKGIPFSLRIDDLNPADTKSVINDPYIETKITSVTLAAYSATTGQLVSAEHFTAGEEVALGLGQDTRASVFAFINMGDMTGVLPASKTGISAVTYDIPAYTGSAESIEERGIPMAGVLEFDEADPTGTTISVRRLLAKVAVDLSLEWDGTITSIQIKGMNKHLTPFGESKARSASDTFSEEIESGNDLRSGTFVFYIPENEQGTVPSIVSSPDKSSDNSALSAVKDRLTYMEVTTTGTGLYSGTMVYRSYLGKNATSDFSITRNCRYTWTVIYKKDGTIEDDWKHENNLSWSAWRYTLTAGNAVTYNKKSISGYIGDTGYCQLRRYVDRYEKGIKRGGSYELTPSDVISWTAEGWTPGNFMAYQKTSAANPSQGIIRGYIMNAEGYGDVRATISDEMGTFTDKVHFYCAGIKPTLILGVTPASIKLGETLQFSLDMHSESNSWSCIDDAFFGLTRGRFGTYVRSGYTFDATSDNRNEYIGLDGKWTPTETGTYEMYACSSKEAAYDIYSNTITFTVSDPDVESYAFHIAPAGPAPRMVNETIVLSAYMDKYVNSHLTERTNVNSSAVWSCDNAAVSVTNGSVTSSLPGTFTVNATCDSPDGEQNASVNVTFTADSNYITLSANPTSVYAGETSTATVLWNGSSDVTSSSAITAYTSESGSTISQIVSISGGTLTGMSAGTCYLEARYTAGGKTYRSARVRLDVMADVYTITLSPKPGSVQMGKTLQFSYAMTRNGSPFTPSPGDISWSLLSGGDKATISSGGLATGVSTGMATVKVTYKADVATDTAALEVTAPSETYRLVSLRVTPNPLCMGSTTGTSVVKYQKYVNGVKTGEALTLSNNDLSWSSSSTDIAMISATGFITPLAAGTATITAIYNGSSLNFETGFDSVSTEVTVLGPLTLAWDSNYTDPKYVAQFARINVSGQSSSGLTITYTAKSNESGLQFNGPSPSGVFVGFLAAGDYTIVATASNGQKGEFSFTVNNPVAVQEWMSRALWVDGEPTERILHYETLEGTAMSVATGDNYGHGTQFAPSLYASLLKPRIVKITPNAHSHFTRFLEVDSNDAVYVKTLKYTTSDPGGDIGNWLGTIFNLYVSAGAEELIYEASFKDPFADVNLADNEEVLHDFTTMYSHMTSGQVNTYSQSQSYAFTNKPGGKLYVDAANVLVQTMPTIESTPNALKGTYTNGDGHISIGLGAGRYYHPSGVVKVYVLARNRYDVAAGGNRETYCLSKQIGHAEIYLHVAWATVVKPKSYHGEYDIRVSNSGVYQKEHPNDQWDMRYLCGGFLGQRDVEFNPEIQNLLNTAWGSGHELSRTFFTTHLFHNQGFQYVMPAYVLTNWYGFVQSNFTRTSEDIAFGLGFAIVKTFSGNGHETGQWSNWRSSNYTSPFCQFNPAFGKWTGSWSGNGLTGHHYASNSSDELIDANNNGYVVVHFLQDLPVNPNNGYVE